MDRAVSISFLRAKKMAVFRTFEWDSVVDNEEIINYRTRD